jgi:serine/threonine protein kinase
MRYCQSCHRCFNDGVEYCLFDQTPTCEVPRLPVIIDEKYRLEQLIAHGGMGAVYRAMHLQLERLVAIKILRAEFLSDEKVAERFKREARAAARLKHPNVIAVYDFGLLPAGGGAYLVMELVEGRSLREEMGSNAARHGQMRPERAVALIRQVCAGVEAAHQRGIIHRDLKPDNIMIEASPELGPGGETVKVLDFGIAKLKESGQTLQSLTDEGTFIGTPNYISPEQCTSLPVDARSDVYSLGVILYEMLTGRVPFSGPNTSTVLLRHLQEPPAPPSRFRSDLGEALEKVALRALAKNPNQRFASAAQLAEHLAEAVRAPQRGVEEDPATRERRHLPAIFVAPAEPGRDHAELIEAGQPSSPALREPRLLLESRSRLGYYVGATVVTLALIGLFGYGGGFDWRPQPRQISAAVTEPIGTQSKPEAQNSAPAVSGLQPPERGAPPDGRGMRTVAVTNTPPVPASLTRPEASPAATPDERAQRELRTLYKVWTAAASRGDWKTHLSYYADRVDYYHDGLLARSKVETRKRRTFSGLDSYTLRFSEAPVISFKLRQGEPQAELVFDKQWVLARHRRRAEGKARTVLTLRRDGAGWRIIGERQLRLFYSATRTVKR